MKEKSLRDGEQCFDLDPVTELLYQSKKNVFSEVWNLAFRLTRIQFHIDMLWSKEILGKELTGKGRSYFNRMSKAVLQRKLNRNEA